jgi:hypothetical protein
MLALPDALALALLVGAAVAFLLGQVALADAHDLQALYWLVVGSVCVQAAVRMGSPGAKA